MNCIVCEQPYEEHYGLLGKCAECLQRERLDEYEQVTELKRAMNNDSFQHVRADYAVNFCKIKGSNLIGIIPYRDKTSGHLAGSHLVLLPISHKKDAGNSKIKVKIVKEEEITLLDPSEILGVVNSILNHNR